MLSRFSFPTRIVFGPRAVSELGNEAGQLGIARPLLVTDRGVVACGLAEQVMAVSRQADHAQFHLYPLPGPEHVPAFNGKDDDHAAPGEGGGGQRHRICLDYPSA